MPVEDATLRVPALEDGLPLLQKVEDGRHMREVELGYAPVAEVEASPRSRAERGHRRCAVCEDNWDRRRTEGFRRRKKVRGHRCHILVGTEGLLVEVKLHSAKVPDQDSIKHLLDSTWYRLPHLSYLWVDVGYQGRDKGWAEEALGVEVEVVNRSPKSPPEKVLQICASPPSTVI